MNVVGNVYDKYGTRNPIARALMQGFLGAVGDLYQQVSAGSVLEVGCGEGKLARHLYELRPAERFEITDVDVTRVEPGLPSAISVRETSIYELPYESQSFDLVVCCEVLEHLEEPQRGLAELARVARHRVLLSTPWEPVWRALNVARGKYLLDLGNTPGHIQHFSRRGLLRLAESELRILATRRPVPWTVLLGEPHRRA